MRVTLQLGRGTGAAPLPPATEPTYAPSSAEVLEQLIRESPHAEEAEALTAAALDLKAAALEGQSPEALAQHLERRLG